MQSPTVVCITVQPFLKLTPAERAALKRCGSLR